MVGLCGTQCNFCLRPPETVHVIRPATGPSKAVVQSFDSRPEARSTDHLGHFILIRLLMRLNDFKILAHMAS